MTKLSDTQLVVLSAACQRDNRSVLPLPANLKGGAAQKVVGSLLAHGYVAEVAAEPEQPVWGEQDAGRRLTLVATERAFQALGIEPDGVIVEEVVPSGAARTASRKLRKAAQAGDTAPNAPDGSYAPTAGDTGSVAAAEGRERKTRVDTKQAHVLAMLQGPEGASLDEIATATNWQLHTIRGFVSGALKRKLGLTVTSEKIEGRGRVYRI